MLPVEVVDHPTGPACAIRHPGQDSGMTSVERRWDIDERGVGIADATQLRPAVERLAEACGRPVGDRGSACASSAAPERRGVPAGVTMDVGVCRGDAGWGVRDRCPARGHRQLHAVRDAIAWLSAVAEPAFFVRRSEPRTVDCVTGMLDGDHEFASHGHTMRLRIALADAAAARCAPAGAPRDQGVIVQRS
jgi:hypothetical protein